MGSTVACTTREQTLDHIEAIKPEEWTQKEVCEWLRLKNNGEFKPLIPAFKQNKISGLTFVRLTIDDLKEKLGIKQFGLRDSFIVARDQVIEHFNDAQVNRHHHHEVHIGPKMERRVPMNTTLPFSKKDYSTVLTKSKSSEVCEPSSLLSNTYSPDSLHQLSLSGGHSPPGVITSNHILFANKQYLYIDLCRVVVGRFCAQNINITDPQQEQAQQDIVNTLCFNYYFENERHIEQFAYDLWKTLRLIDIKAVNVDDTNGSHAIRGFTGSDLMKHISSHLPQYELSSDDVSSLISHSYIRLVAIIDDSYKLVQKFKNREKDSADTNYFECSGRHLYQFENDQHRRFIKQDEPDRDSWNNGCDVNVYSETLKRWNIATIIDINDDMITVQYAGNIRKTLDRYQDHNVIKSLAQYIENRTHWAKHSELQIYSNRHNNWFLGEIHQVIIKNDEQSQPHDVFEIHYTDCDGKLLSKYVERWSPEIREISGQLHECLSVFKRGSNVLVWSKSQQRWLPGVITGVIQQHKIVNVRYGECEKLLPWNSNDLQLCDGNAKTLLEAYKKNRYQFK